ncbi:exporter of polyketide antibiotics [Actinomadura vinacea]|uniref:Exporter of polyketide antibiotics n=1 Tax=Actinomadura vinacea TaxID=115336 RepID=A0ABP5VC27_9ACTN
MKALTGTWTLARLALRRDRIRLPVWVLLAAGLVASTASTMKSSYTTEEQRREYAESVVSNPASAVFSGPGFGADTLGGMTVAEAGALLVFLLALPAVLLVVRHTRAEEEAGRAELLGAAILGRHARLASAMLVAGAVMLAIACVTALSLIGYGAPVAGSLAFGFSMALVGWTFAGVAAVTAQFFAHARTATGAAAAVFGLAFMLRAAGDASAASGDGGVVKHLSWLSPIGWAQQVRPFGGERWWVFALPIAAVALLTGAAVRLGARRDVDAGLIAPRPGRPGGSPYLASSWGLAWRLQRGGLIGWAAGVAVVAGVFGAVAHDIEELVGSNEDVADSITKLGGGDTVTNGYLAWVLTITGFMAAAYAITAVLRLRTEETGLRAEPVLATTVTRRRWVASHLACAAAGTVALMVVAGLVVGTVHGLRSGDMAGELSRMLAGALVRVPAALILAAGGVAVFGLLPRVTAFIWALAAGALVLEQLGGVLELDQRVLNLSPFAHTPDLPGGDFSATPLIWLGGISAGLVVAGLVGFRRRDTPIA